jgi:ribose 5-phosphate isomerase RpiB
LKAQLTLQYIPGAKAAMCAETPDASVAHRKNGSIVSEMQLNERGKELNEWLVRINLNEGLERRSKRMHRKPTAQMPSVSDEDGITYIQR